MRSTKRALDAGDCEAWLGTVISPFSVIISFGISALVGIVFGIYPARQAAKMDPIAALRLSEDFFARRLLAKLFLSTNPCGGDEPVPGFCCL